MFNVKRLMRATALVVVAGFLLAGCGGGDDSTSPDTPDNAKFLGKWRLVDIHDPAVYWDIVYSPDNTFVGYIVGESAVKISGTYAVDDKGVCTGDWRSHTSSRIGKIEAWLESDTVMYFKFIETNAFNNPEAVNGVVFTEHRGSRI